MKIKCRDGHGNEHEFDESLFIDRPAVYGVLIEYGHVLMVKDSISGKWDLPGGGVDEGEDLETSLRREFVEETGIQIHVDVSKITEYSSYFYDIGSKQCWNSYRNFYTVSRAGGKLNRHGNGDDVTEAKFIPLSQLKNLTLTYRTEEMIELAQKHI